MVAISFENAKPKQAKQEPEPILTYTAIILFVLSGICVTGAMILVIHQDSVQRKGVTVEIASKSSVVMVKSNDTLAFEAKKKEIMDQAKYDKLLMDRLYARGATTSISEMSFAKKLTIHGFQPDPARFQGVEELLQLTGQNQTLAKFLYFGIPLTKTIDWTPDYPRFFAEGIKSEDIVIGGCSYSNSTCHKKELSFVKDDLHILETFTSEFSQISFTRVFYIPARVLLASLRF